MCWYWQLSNCARVHRLEHNYIVRYMNISTICFGSYGHHTIVYLWLTNTTRMTHLEDLLLFLEVLQNNTQCNSASSKNEKWMILFPLIHSIRICACLRRTSKPSCLHFLSAWNFLFQLKRALREKLKFSQLVKNFHAFYGIWKFITAFTIAHHLFLSWKIRSHLFRGLSGLFAT